MKKYNKRKASGTYYTPPEVVNYIVQACLGPVVAQATREVARRYTLSSSQHGQDLWYVLEPYVSLAILDPAMGSGHFLLGAAQFVSQAMVDDPCLASVLATCNVKNPLLFCKQLVVTHCLYGVDSDPFAVELAHLSLWLDSGGAWCPTQHLCCGDCLMGVDWEQTFPVVFASSRRAPGFDAVVGNPPYVSFGVRGTATLTKQQKAAFLHAFPNSAEYKISLYALFMEMAVRVTRAAGFHGFIVPDSFLQGKYFSRIRAYLLEETYIQTITLLRQNIWYPANVGLPVIYVVQKKPATDDRVCATEAAVHVCIADTLEQWCQGISFSDSMPQDSFVMPPQCKFRLLPGNTTRRIVRHMELQSMPLKQMVKFYSGLIGKKGQKSIILTDIGSCHCGQSVDSCRDMYAPLIASSTCLERYALTYQGAYCPKDAGYYKSGYMPVIYENPKLFLNQTGYHLKCCYDGNGYYCLNNMHIGYSTSATYSLLYANALLCSRLLGFYYGAITLEDGRANAQIDIDSIDALPVRCIAFTTPEDERMALVGQARHLYAAICMAWCKDRSMTATVYEAIRALLGLVQQQVSCTPERADVVHDIVVLLAEQMIAMHMEYAAKARCGACGSDELMLLRVRRLCTDYVIDQIVFLLYAVREDDVGMAKGAKKNTRKKELE